MFQRYVLSLFVFLTLLVQGATAQPPGIIRWPGSTANSQSQGFAQGAPLVLTWSIAPDQTTLTNGDSNDLRSFFDGIYSGGIDEYQPIFESAIGRWGEVSGLTLVYEPNDDGMDFTVFNNSRGQVGVRGDIRFGGRFIDGNSGTLAQARFPRNGDVTIDTGDSFYTLRAFNSLGLRNVVAHEVGHSLGFFTVAGHVVSSDTRQLLEPSISRSFDGPQYHDILAVQRAYGDIYETGNGNDTANNATDLGSLLSGESVVLGESAHRRGNSALFTAKPTGIEIQPDEVDFISIDDQSDTDVFSFTVAEAGQVEVVLDTLGESYMAGGQNQGEQILFDTSERVDLTLEILDTDGQTVLATSDSGGLGDDEILPEIELAIGGTYFVRITGVDNSDPPTLDTQFYGLSVAFESSPRLGDVNVDGEVDFEDIAPFIAILSAGGFQVEADVNEDGMVSFSDIALFVGLLSS